MTSQALFDPPAPWSRTHTFHVATDGSDNNNGGDEHHPFKTIGHAVSVASDSSHLPSLCDIIIWPGDYPFTTQLQPRFGVRLKGFSDNGYTQSTTLVWNGPDDGTPAIKMTNQDSRGLFREFNLVWGYSPTSVANGIELFDAQNGAEIVNVTVGKRGNGSPYFSPKGFGFAFTSDDVGAGTPGYVLMHNCWTFECNFMQTLPPYTNFDLYGCAIGNHATQAHNGAIEVLAAQTNPLSTRAQDGHISLHACKAEIHNTSHLIYCAAATGLLVEGDFTIDSPSTKSVIYYDAPLTTLDNGLPIDAVVSARGFSDFLIAPQQSIRDSIDAGGGRVTRRSFAATRFAPHVWEGTHGPITAQSVNAVSPNTSTITRTAVAYPAQTVNVDEWQVATVVDTFTRADSTALGTANTGQVWTNHRSPQTVGITSNKAYNTAGTTAQTHEATLDALTADGTLQCDITQGASGSNLFVLFRFTDVNNKLNLSIRTSTGIVSLKKTASGTSTTLATHSYTAANSQTDTWKVVLRGPLITVYQNTTVIMTYTLTGGDETTFGSATRIGLGGSDSSTGEPGGTTGTLFDNFSWTTASLRVTSAGLLGVAAPDTGTTKTTPGGVDKWMRVDIGGTAYFSPLYASKTA